jgi:hypothetical protein
VFLNIRKSCVKDASGFGSHLVLNITVVAEKWAAKEAHQQLSNREKYFHSDNVLNIKKDHWTQLTK